LPLDSELVHNFLITASDRPGGPDTSERARYLSRRYARARHIAARLNRRRQAQTRKANA